MEVGGVHTTPCRVTLPLSTRGQACERPGAATNERERARKGWGERVRGREGESVREANRGKVKKANLTNSFRLTIECVLLL